MSLKVYRGRTLARSQALQLLFQAEATDSPLERVLEGDFLISKGPLDPYALELCRGAYEHIDRHRLRSARRRQELGSYAHARAPTAICCVSPSMRCVSSPTRRSRTPS